MKTINIVLALSISLSVVSCRKSVKKVDSIKTENRSKINHLELPLKNSKNEFMAVIEIPAGTNHKIEYHKTNHEFVCDQRDGKDRIIDFLPYPSNYGFIPSTMMDKDRGGDGDALDLLIIGESVATGTYMPIKILGIMYLIDSDEEDHKLLAVPAVDSLNVLGAHHFEDLNPQVLHIISDWFSNYKGAGVMEFLKFGDEQAALVEIEKWRLK